jgi:hypothetical protein
LSATSITFDINSKSLVSFVSGLATSVVGSLSLVVGSSLKGGMELSDVDIELRSIGDASLHCGWRLTTAFALSLSLSSFLTMDALSETEHWSSLGRFGRRPSRDAVKQDE